MDPLTITASVVALITRISESANDIYQAYQLLRNAPQTLTELVDEIQVVQGSLLLLERLIREKPNGALPAEVQDVFPIALKGCEATLLCLQIEFVGLEGEVNWWLRVKIAWKDEKMRRLLDNLGRRKISIVLLTQCLQL